MPTSFIASLRLLPLLCALSPLLCSVARAGEVVAHPTVMLSANDIRDVYLGEKQLEGNLRLVAVDNAGAQDGFLAAILQTTRRNYEARWTRKTFREGVRAPLVKGSDAEVLNFVRSTPGAIGYVSNPAGPGVHVLASY